MGLPVKTYTFSGNYEFEKVVSFYKKKWRPNKNSGLKENYVEPWYILSRLNNKFLYSLQIKKISPFEVFGYISVSDTRELGKKRAQKYIPALSGSTTLNDYPMNDLGKKGRVILLNNSHTIEANHDFYAHYYQSHGWNTDLSKQTVDSSLQVFKNGNKQAHIVISGQKGKIQVVINTEEF